MNRKSVIREQDIASVKYETFDLSYFEKKGRKNSHDQKVHTYTKEDGTKVDVSGLGGDFSILEYPPTPYFYEIIKTYYANGGLKYKGVYFPQTCRVGKWFECDESGKCETIDYDENMGEFDYADVLIFLSKNKYINLKTGEGKENFTMGYSYEQKYWQIEATKDRVHWIKYILDGNTGKILKEEQLPLLN